MLMSMRRQQPPLKPMKAGRQKVPVFRMARFLTFGCRSQMEGGWQVRVVSDREILLVPRANHVELCDHGRRASIYRMRMPFCAQLERMGSTPKICRPER